MNRESSTCPMLLIEIGTEELPSSYMSLLEQKLQDRFQAWLLEESWPKASETCLVHLTPRRIVFTIGTIEDKQQKKEEWLKGPPMKVAFTPDNQETPALKGFLNRCRTTTYEIRTLENGQYVFGLAKPENQTVIDFFQLQFPNFLLNFPYEKLMRWGQYRFIRPIKWVLALYGSILIPMKVLDTEARLFSRLLQGQGEIPVASIDDYFRSITKQSKIVLSVQERCVAIRKQLGSNHPASPDDSVIMENACRTEVPVVENASFPEAFTRLPHEIIETVLSSQMKCFPIYDTSGKLTNQFSFVMNGFRKTDLVKKGFEKVVTARLSDADYFYHQDQKVLFVSREHLLSKVLFMEKLGTMEQKVKRILYVTEHLGKRYNELNDPLLPTLVRLYKLDLTTLLVQELTALQGTVGKIYIQESDKTDLISHDKDKGTIAEAIEQSYWPQSDEDSLPTTEMGKLISLLDRWDTWIGIHCIGLNPSSSSDPFGIRRIVNGLLRILEERPGYIPLLEFVNTGMEAYRQINGLEFDETTVLTEWKAYYIQRMQSFLSGSVHFGKHRYDLIQAVLNRTDSRLVRSPRDIKQQVEAMEAHVTDPEFKALCQSFVRIQKILNTSFQSGSINPDKLELKAEQELLSIGQSTEKELKTLFHIDNSSIECFDPKKILSTLYQLNQPIQQFFDEVMVMVEDVAIRENRLRLLSWLLSMMSDFADFSTIVFDGGNEQ